MRVLITGGFGYLGGRLAQYLTSHGGYEIVLGSRRQTTPPYWLAKAAVVDTAWDSPDRLRQICAGIDTVIHLAGMNAQECSANPVAALNFNGVATARLVHAAARQEVKRFIYLSTFHVYGSPLTGRITEETCAVSLHPYASSHRAGEDVVRAVRQAGLIDGVVIRLSNAYGPPTHEEANCWTLLVNDLCRQVVTSRRMMLRSSGLQRRDFIPLADACRAIRHFLELPAKNLGHGLFNVGGGWSPTIGEMACLIQQRCEAVLGFQPELTCIPPQPGETSSDLDFRIDALCQSGFQAGHGRTVEIDRLLEFCNRSNLGNR